MDENEARIRKWRLLLGRESEAKWSAYGKDSAPYLSEEDRQMDAALEAIYNADAYFAYGDTQPGGGSGRGSAVISRWLGDLRILFPPELVKLVEGDAVERCGMKELLFEPELLDAAEPSVDLGSMLLLLKDQVPKQSRESARRFIQRIVEEIQRRLAEDVRRAVVAACKRTEHTPIPSATGLDFKKTIRHGLKNYDAAKKRILPEKYYFFAKQQNNAAKYHIILDIDQSGSMGESVLYASVMSSILASLRAVKTHVVAFTTEVVDLSDKIEDPVELLFGFQLGGGTDINNSVKYCETLIEEPKKTLFFLITDLMEGGNRAALMRRIAAMKEAGVRVIVLLAIADGGAPYYDEHNAKHIASLGIPCFACAPERLPELLAAALKDEDLSQFSGEARKG